MERWSGKIAVVTGASSGIGAAIAVALLRCDLIVVGLARRVERIEALRQHPDLSDNADRRANLHPMHCDVADPASIRRAFAVIEQRFGSVQILVNNAGVTLRTGILTEGNEAQLNAVIDTNLRGLMVCTKCAYRLMGGQQEFGHIVNINSVLGHSVGQMSVEPLNNVYPATKFAVRAMSEVLRQELNFMRNRRVKISSISPGLVKTDIITASGCPDSAAIFARTPHLHVDSIASALLYVLGTPPDVQVYDLIIKPVGEKI